jgi:hypothetical protein
MALPSAFVDCVGGWRARQMRYVIFACKCGKYCYSLCNDSHFPKRAGLKKSCGSSGKVFAQTTMKEKRTYGIPR